MILISKSEKEQILERFPKIHIVRTMKQDSKRHHYYMVEEPGAMKLLRKLRGEPEVKEKRNKKKGRVNHTDREAT